MNRDLSDDPRHVLAILNNLGVVGLNATELKAFMKELKIYRKEREKYKEQWKEETKIKLLLQQGYFRNHLINILQPSTDDNVFPVTEKKSKHNIKLPKNHFFKETLSQPEFHKHEFINIDKSKLIDNGHPAKEQKFKEKIKPMQNTTSKTSPKKFKSEFHEANDVRPTEILNKNSKDQNRAPSIEKLELQREPSAKSHKSIASSVISSNKSCRPSSGLKTSKKIGSDPVTLYNQYKQYWSKLSFPGEEPHTKLRWAVREKMLGSQPNPRLR